jgi:hypothetical protein
MTLNRRRGSGGGWGTAQNAEDWIPLQSPARHCLQRPRSLDTLKWGNNCKQIATMIVSAHRHPPLAHWVTVSFVTLEPIMVA